MVVPPDGLDGVLDGVLEQLVNLSLTLSLAFVLLVLLVPFRFDPLVAVSDLLRDNGFPPPTAFVVVLVGVIHVAR